MSCPRCGGPLSTAEAAAYNGRCEECWTGTQLDYAGLAERWSEVEARLRAVRCPVIVELLCRDGTYLSWRRHGGVWRVCAGVNGKEYKPVNECGMSVRVGVIYKLPELYARMLKERQTWGETIKDAVDRLGDFLDSMPPLPKEDSHE